METQIDRSSGSLPVYRQLSKILETEIRKNCTTGDMLPSESELSERYHVNRHTLRRAVDELIVAGFVDRIHGKGTIVLNTPINYTINHATRFTETLESQGYQTISRILDKKQIHANASVARQLKIKEEKPVILVETMREVDGIPFCSSSHYFPFPDYKALFHKYDGGSLHGFIRQHYGKRLRRVLSLVCSEMPDKRDIEQLCLPHNTPVLRVKSLNINEEDGIPVESVVTRFRSDAVQLSIET